MSRVPRIPLAAQRDLLRDACDVARQSPDRSTKNGATLVCFRPKHGYAEVYGDMGHYKLSACNCYVHPQTEAAHEIIQANREFKLGWTEHAERNVLFDAHREGLDTEGSIMLCPFAACTDCARAMVAFGVRELIYMAPAVFCNYPERWRESIAMAHDILRFSGVLLTTYAGPPLDTTFFLDGKEWPL